MWISYARDEIKRCEYKIKKLHKNIETALFLLEAKGGSDDGGSENLVVKE